MTSPATAPTPVRPWVRRAYLVAAILTGLSVAMGSLVCATESGMACPNWPGCYPDQVTPNVHVNPIIEWLHRVVAVTTGPAILAALAGSLTRPRSERLTRHLPWVTLVGAIAAAVFGRLVVLYGIPPALGVLDLGLSLVAAVAIITATVALHRTPYALVRNRTAAAAWAGVGVLVVMHVLGILTASTGSFTRCMGWPIWRVLDADHTPTLQVVRIVLAAIATGLVAVTVHGALGRRDLRTPALLLAGLWALELGTGLVMGGARISFVGAAIYSLAAVGILLTLAFLAARAGIEPVRHATPVRRAEAVRA